MKVSAPHLIDALFQEYPEGSEGSSCAQEPGEELTRTVLSAEASRLRDLGLPIRLLPMPREGTRAALREYTLSLNQIIAGQPSHPQVWSFVQHHLPADRAAEFEPLFKAHFHPLWTREELRAWESGSSARSGAAERAGWRAGPRPSAPSARTASSPR